MSGEHDVEATARAILASALDEFKFLKLGTEALEFIATKLVKALRDNDIRLLDESFSKPSAGRWDKLCVDKY